MKCAHVHHLYHGNLPAPEKDVHFRCFNDARDGSNYCGMHQPGIEPLAAPSWSWLWMPLVAAAFIVGGLAVVL